MFGTWLLDTSFNSGSFNSAVLGRTSFEFMSLDGLDVSLLRCLTLGGALCGFALVVESRILADILPALGDLARLLPGCPLLQGLVPDGFLTRLCLLLPFAPDLCVRPCLDGLMVLALLRLLPCFVPALLLLLGLLFLGLLFLVLLLVLLARILARTRWYGDSKCQHGADHGGQHGPLGGIDVHCGTSMCVLAVHAGKRLLLDMHYAAHALNDI